MSVQEVEFAEAARRHQRDGEVLYDGRRWANADQLFGVAAECALKAVMEGLGMTLRDDGAPEKRKHRVHMDKLWDTFRTFAQGSSAAHYASLLSAQNPFSDWSVNQRYWRSSAIERRSVDAHLAGMKEAMGVLSSAKQDGRIP